MNQKKKVVHNIVDISPLYHRFAYAMRASNSKSTVPIMYLVMSQIEMLREEVEKRGSDVITSACFDSRSYKKKVLLSKEASEYKSGRTSILTEYDFKDIEIMKEILSDAGVNVFYRDGCEADDIIGFLAGMNKDYDLSVIYSTDKDMMVNVHGTVGMRRYTNGVWNSIAESNFREVAIKSFKTNIPHNAIGLYLCTAGDSADKIKGIHKFGGKAFESMVSKLEGHVDYSSLVDYNNVMESIVLSRELDILNNTQFEQAREAFNLVRNIEITEKKLDCKDDFELIDKNGFKTIRVSMDMPLVMKVETIESRVQAYSNAGMKSLAK